MYCDAMRAGCNRAAAIACALACAPPPAMALLQSCTVAATTVNFATYNPQSATTDDAVGTVTVTCSVTLLGLLESWTIALSTGGSGTFANRQMSSAGHHLTYNLYTNATRTTVWGDGTAGTSVVSDSRLLSVGTNNYSYSVYGRVPIAQDRPPGTYVDGITVTLNY
jgi:spore coat protein U-like protein